MEKLYMKGGYRPTKGGCNQNCVTLKEVWTMDLLLNPKCVHGEVNLGSAPRNSKSCSLGGKMGQTPI